MENILLITIAALSVILATMFTYRVGYQSGYMQHMEDIMEDEIED